MKEHFCSVEQSLITYEGSCNWCGEREGSMTQEALKLALEFIENSECGTADLEARIKEALKEHAMREVQRLGQEIEQEPVIDKSAATRIATSLGWSPQRTWVGLTDEALDDVYFCVEGGATPLETWREQARAIEAKLKEKNNA